VISVDTNGVVRLLTGDDPAQTAAAADLFKSNRIGISKTVILETEWVLRKGYGFDSTAIHNGFIRLMSLRSVDFEDPESVAMAMDLNLKGVDSADALHVFSCPDGAQFVTFDGTLMRRARRAGAAGISEPAELN
jgi:predicted nucleic-acid-binding protein